jgi:hypothetical protein
LEGELNMRISRSTGAFSGFALVILGLWGAIIPFIGPGFGYAFGNHTTWYYTADRLYLDILPGIAVMAGGLILLWSGNRVSGVLGSWLAIAGGAWFVVGPAFSRMWEHGPGPIGGPLFGSARQTLELVGYFYGLGALIVALAAFGLGRVVTRQRLVTETPATTEPLAGQPVDHDQPIARRPEPVARDEDDDRSIPAIDAPPEPAAEPEREHVTTSSVAGAL